QMRPLPGTYDAVFPFWSPDGRYIGFFAESKLKKIAAGGGPPQSLCAASDGRGGSWNKDDVIVFSPGGGAGRTRIQRISAAGGVPAEVTRLDNDRFPAFLPDGRHLLYTVNGGKVEIDGIHVISLDSTLDRRILADVSGAVFASSGESGKGHLFFV